MSDDHGHPAGEVGELLLAAGDLARVANEAMADGRYADALDIAETINDMLRYARDLGESHKDSVELAEWLLTTT